MTRYELDSIPFDKVFSTNNGEELCHATGFSVSFDGKEFWNEYIDSDENLHYGR